MLTCDLSLDFFCALVAVQYVFHGSLLVMQGKEYSLGQVDAAIGATVQVFNLSSVPDEHFT